MSSRAALSVEERRRNVDELLHRGTDQKLLRGSAREAQALLEEALEVAEMLPKLPDPWIPLLSYRLAHLAMREAGGGKKLLAADVLFARAARCRPLGPLPPLYRLSALARLSQAGEVQDPELVARAFAVANERVHDSQRESADRDAARPQATGLQNSAFNMLELAAYFLGFPYQDLEGGGRGPYQEFGDMRRPWILVGPDPLISEVRYPKKLAIAELEARVDGRPGVLGFKLSADGAGAHWRAQAAWVSATPSHLRYLVLVLQREQIDLDRLARQVLQKESPDPESHRQVKKRLLAEVAERLGISSDAVFAAAGSRGLPRLAADVVIYGAIDARCAAR